MSISLLYILFNAISFIFFVKSFSIGDFIDKIKKDGGFNLIEQAQETFGDPVAIEFCNQIYNTEDCENLVRTYMHSEPRIYIIGTFTLKEKIENFQILKSIVEKYKYPGNNTRYSEIILHKIAKKFDGAFSSN